MLDMYNIGFSEYLLLLTNYENERGFQYPLNESAVNRFTSSNSTVAQLYHFIITSIYLYFFCFFVVHVYIHLEIYM